MSTETIEKFEGMLAAGNDSALLRFSLGNEHLKNGDPATATSHLQRAVELDPAYSAAWKLLGRALQDDGHPAEALAAYERGISAAERRGDRQAAKEMAVFARRMRRHIS